MATESARPEVEPSGVFARDATGLVREVSPILASVFNFSNAPVGLVLVYSAVIGFGFFAGGNILLGILIAIIGSVPVLLNYAMMTSSMPRSGGDYVYVSRLIHPSVGFAANFGLSVFQIIGTGAVAVFFSLTGVVPAFASIGQITGIEWFNSAANWAGGKNGSFIIAVVILTVLALLLARGTATALRFNSGVWLIGFFSLVVMLLVLGMTSNAMFISRFNAFVQGNAGVSNAYQNTIDAARASGFAELGGFKGLWGLIAVGMFGVGWFFWSTYISGEIKGARQLRATTWVMLSGQLLNGGLYLLGTFLFLHVFGKSFISAATWLLFNDPDKVRYFTGAGAHIVFFTAIASSMKWLSILFVITFIAWGWPLLTCYALQVQRCAFAWSFDQLMPRKLSEVSERTHTPLTLIAVVWVLSIIAAAIAAYTNFIFQIYASTFLGTALYSMLVSSIAATVFPYRGKDIYRLSPISNVRLGRIPTITVTGILGTAFTIFWGLAYVWLEPFGMHSHSAILTIVLVGSFGAGLVIYYVARSVRMRQGVPMDLVFAQVPPE